MWFFLTSMIKIFFFPSFTKLNFKNFILNQRVQKSSLHAKKNGQLNSPKCGLAVFGQSNKFVRPIFAVLGPLSLTDRTKVLEGVVNSPASLVL